VNKIRTSLAISAIAALAIGLGSCSPPATLREGDSATAQTQPPAIETAPETTAPDGTENIASRRSLRIPSEEFAVRPTDESAEKVSVTIYNLDDRCEQFVPEKVEVPATKSIEAAIGEVLDREDTADFSLAGYRVSVEGTVATVDLRLATSSKRKFTSLSSCEQRALFIALKETLTKNAEWNIQTVRFTERGEEIVL